MYNILSSKYTPTLGGGFNLSLTTNGTPSRDENRDPAANMTISANK